MVPVLAIVFGVIFLVLKFMLSRTKSKQANIPRVPGLPLIGNALDVLPHNVIQALSNYPRMYGGIVEFYVLQLRTYMVSDIDTVKEIMLKRPKKIRRAKMFNHASETLKLDVGLFFSEGNLWQKLRRGSAPSFSSLTIAKRFHDIAYETVQWAERMKANLVDGKTGVIDMKYESFSYTIRAISMVAFGLDPNDPVTSFFYSRELLDAMMDMFKFMNDSAFNPLPAWAFKYYGNCERNAIIASEKLDLACQRVVDHKLKLRQENPNYDVRSMMDSILSSTGENAMSNEEILSNAKTLYLAGSDTTSVAITWVTFFLATHPEYQERVRQEAIELLFKDRSPSDAIADMDISELQHMKWCQLIMKETLRLGSPASFVGYETIDETITFSNGFQIGPDECMWVTFDAILTDPAVFENPLEWDPERWLTEDVDKIKAMNEIYIPFGFGGRNCPGMILAQNEIIIAIAMLCYYFKMSLDCPKEEIHRELRFVACANKMPVRLEARV